MDLVDHAALAGAGDVGAVLRETLRMADGVKARGEIVHLQSPALSSEFMCFQFQGFKVLSAEALQDTVSSLPLLLGRVSP